MRSSIEHRIALDGLPVIEVVFDVAAEQVAGAAHALRVIRDARHRTQEMSADDVLTMRELTSLVDELDDLAVHKSAVTLRANAARLGTLRDGLEEFAAAEHIERAGDAQHRGAVFVLADHVRELHAQAIRAALAGPPVAS